MIRVKVKVVRFSLNAAGKGWSLSYTKTIHKRKSTVWFYSLRELDGRSWTADVIGEILHCLWNMWPGHKLVMYILEI